MFWICHYRGNTTKEYCFHVLIFCGHVKLCLCALHAHRLSARQPISDFAARRSWMQLQRHPHIHLTDPYGSFRRPEWALLDAAAAYRASGEATGSAPAERAAPEASLKLPQRTSAIPVEGGASECGGMVTATMPMKQRQPEAMQGVLALVDIIDEYSGRVPSGDVIRPATTLDAIFRRRVWLASAAAATLSLRTILVRSQICTTPSLRAAGLLCPAS